MSLYPQVNQYFIDKFLTLFEEGVTIESDFLYRVDKNNNLFKLRLSGGRLMNSNDDVVIIIPAYNPDDKFIRFLSDLSKFGYRNIIVIDDGSREDTKHYFNEAVDTYNCALVKHGVNLGQGRAYKSGFNYFLNNCGGGGTKV